MRDKKPHGFCKTPEEKCTMNYCDDNGCVNRKRSLDSKIKYTPVTEASYDGKNVSPYLQDEIGKLHIPTDRPESKKEE